jgi:thiamine-monophosphate kinase
MSRKKLNEFELITKLTRSLPGDSRVIKGVGDDCAVLKQPGGKYLLATCDIQVDGVHFLSGVANPGAIGHKAVAVNVSDIATMGGIPTFCLVSLVLPNDKDSDFVELLYDGIKTACSIYGVQIIGGNISSGKQLAVDIFMMGEVNPDELLLRSGAKPGDKLLVTGALGEAAAGLELIKNGAIILSETDRADLLNKQLSPIARLSESNLIAKSKLATSMIDISDGLLGDVSHICDESKVGVVIYEKQVPVLASVTQVEKQLANKSLSLAITGGEDYELLMTASPDAAEKIIKIVKEKTGTDVSVIGEITPTDTGRWIFGSDGQMRPFAAEGWDHLAEDE